MSQLPLDLQSKLIYQPDSFYIHSGIKEVYEKLELLISEPNYFLSIVKGNPRFGKTHLGIKLTELGVGYYDEIFSSENIPEEKVVVLDDADKLIHKQEFASFFVALFEEFKKNKRGLILFTTSELQDMTNDPNILSRLDSGFNLSIDPPTDETFGEVILRIGLQRGIQFSKRQIAFLEKRVSRDIAQIEKFVDKLNEASVLEGERIVYSVMSENL